MPLQKNQLLPLRIERLSNDGSGVALSLIHISEPTRP